MEKTIVIDGKDVKFKTSGAVLLRYKAQFGKDYLSEIIKLAALEKLGNKKKISTEDIQGLDFEVMYNVAWVLAKTADPTIPDPMAWLDSFEEFPMMDIIPELTPMITSSMTQTKKK